MHTNGMHVIFLVIFYNMKKKCLFQIIIPTKIGIENLIAKKKNKIERERKYSYFCTTSTAFVIAWWEIFGCGIVVHKIIPQR